MSYDCGKLVRAACFINSPLLDTSKNFGMYRTHYSRKERKRRFRALIYRYRFRAIQALVSLTTAVSSC